ncbi:hypothetical protein OH77DRAFT_752431 [Trametes cingulata]|nr:hypothetical protein OH77DRAFT_752431 [Trametes cingulata]
MAVSKVAPGLLFVLLSTYVWRSVRADSLPQEWPTCSNPAFSWMNNEKGQTSCDVMQQLLAFQCDGDMGAGPAGAPQRLQDTPCVCNTVMYSLVSACSMCADWSQISWTEYSQRYPAPVPPGASIPAWAYLGLTNNQFNVQAAQSRADQLKPAPDNSSKHRPSLHHG